MHVRFTLLGLAPLALLLGIVGEARAIAIINPSFETPEAICCTLPSTTGDWGGDSGQIVTAQGGVTPFDGIRMLEFGPGGGNFSDVWQLVDVSALSGAIDAGLVTVAVSAYFNRARVADPNERFDMEFRTFARPPQSIAEYDALPLVPRVNFPLFADADPATWEPVTGSLLLPPGTRVFGVAISSLFGFEGHYADEVRLAVSGVPVPGQSPLVLLASGLAGLGGVAWRRCRRK